MELELVGQHVCMRKDIGIHGNLFGGYMMCWLDEAGAIYASKMCNSYRVVTLKMNEVIFKSPVSEGDVVKIFASEPAYGNTSIKFKLQAFNHNPITGERDLVCETEMVFVKIDRHGKKSKIIK